MKESEYRRLRQTIEERYRKDLEALDRVWAMSKPTTSGVDSLEGTTLQLPKRGAVLGLVRTAISSSRGEFTLQDIERHIRDLQPNAHVKRASISSALKRLAESNEIETVTVGSGKRPSMYRSSKADSEGRSRA